MSLSRNLGRAISIAAIALAAPAIGQIKTGAGGGTEIAEAARPVDEGVPEVAVYQLQKLVSRLSGADAVKAKEKLAEALIAARRSTEALRLLDEPVLRDSTSGKFLRAQAFAALNRSSEALQLYREVANNDSVPQRAAAAFGAGEMLRALDRADEAIRAYHALENDPRFGISARLREAELFIAKQDSVMAKRILDGTQTKIATDKRQKRLLHARIELLNQRPEKAVGLLDSLVKKPEGESRETAIAALFAMADAHLQMNTPEAGDDYLEDFIDRHPIDPALPQVFAKLDQVSRAKRTARWPPRRSNPAVRTNSKDNASAGGACTRALAICAAANRGGENQRSACYPERSGKNEPDAASARANRFRIGTRNVRGAEISGRSRSFRDSGKRSLRPRAGSAC
jgi:thioredoxin-like negative regulator of GroEL